MSIAQVMTVLEKERITKASACSTSNILCSSYCGLAYMVDMVFPPRPEPSDGRQSRASREASGASDSREGSADVPDPANAASDQEMFSGFLYWRDPLPEPVELSGAVQKSDALTKGLDLVVAAGPDMMAAVEDPRIIQEPLTTAVGDGQDSQNN
jgi:hypothetical protein